MKPNKDVNAGAEAERGAILRKVRAMIKGNSLFADFPELERWIVSRTKRTIKPGGVGRR